VVGRVVVISLTLDPDRTALVVNGWLICGDGSGKCSLLLPLAACG